MPIFAGAVAGAKGVFMGSSVIRGSAAASTLPRGARGFGIGRPAGTTTTLHSYQYSKPNFTPLGRAVTAYGAYKGAEAVQKEGGRKHRKHLQ